MRVLHVDHSSAVSGGEHSLLELLTALPDSVESMVACPPGPLADQVTERGAEWIALREDPNLRYFSQLGIAVGLGLNASAVARLARRRGVDVVHAHSLRASLTAAAARRLGGPATVAHVRDVLPAGRLSRIVKGLVRRNVDGLLAVSEYVACAFEGTHHPKTKVVHNCVDLERFSPTASTRADARARLGLGERTPVAVLVGQLTPWKGQLEAIEAVASIRDEWPEITLLIVGQVTFPNSRVYDNLGYQRTLHDSALAAGGDAIRFLGQRSDVPELLRAADVAVVPSWEEPFGRTIIEAMAAGVPVIATSVGGPPEIIEHDRDGLLVEPRNPELWAATIAELLEDPARCARLAAAGRKRAEAQFACDRHAAQVLSFYDDVQALRQSRSAPGGGGRGVAESPELVVSDEREVGD
jgi:L-malate glycosyltransferase